MNEDWYCGQCGRENGRHRKGCPESMEPPIIPSPHDGPTGASEAQVAALDRRVEVVVKSPFRPVETTEEP